MTDLHNVLEIIPVQKSEKKQRKKQNKENFVVKGQSPYCAQLMMQNVRYSCCLTSVKLSENVDIAVLTR